MYDYEEACPISKAASILCERWTLQIIREMLFGATRFSEFERYLPKLSPTLLNTRLKTLEQQGIILRRRVPEKRGYEYQLTPKGQALQPVLSALGRWGMDCVFTDIDPRQLNVSTLIRDFAVALKIEQLPRGETVIQFTVTDDELMVKKFLLVRDGRVQICDENMGYEVNVYLGASPDTLGRIWFGRLGVAEACEGGLLTAVGDGFLVRNLSRWLGVSQLAEAPAGGG